MKLYKVGGCVRDQLMGIEPRDVDWLVVGATPHQMAALGYVQVGADFPVFLHPESKEEYALARKERKVGLGHKGFETRFDPSVTLEEDLSRRDLTINAMAQDVETGEIQDPFGGRRDLTDRKLRHVSSAFSEDPLRVLRLARFQARTGFAIDPSTLALCQSICASGALRELSAERVCAELRKLLESERPAPGLAALLQMGALASLDPTWPARLGPAQLAAVDAARAGGMPEWALARHACCSGLGSEAGAKALEALRFPSDMCKWSARVGGFCHWAKAALSGGRPEDFGAACAELERCGAPKLSADDRAAFAATCDAELATWGVGDNARIAAAEAIKASAAIASADLSAALAQPKPELPKAVRQAKSEALERAWGAPGAGPSRPRP